MVPWKRPQSGGGIISRQHATKSLFSRRAGLIYLVVFALGTGAGLLIASRLDVGNHVHQLRLAVRSQIVRDDDSTPGQWGRIQLDRTDLHLSSEQEAEAERLRSLGYLGGSVPSHGASGVTCRCDSLASSCVRYYTSGHGPVAYLMDAAGSILHSWRFTFDQARAAAEAPEDFLPDHSGSTACWRRTRLLENGDLLAVFEGHGLIKLDRDSHLLWAYPGHCHHDLDVGPDGEIYVLTREAMLVPRIHPSEPVLLDYITRLSPEGRELDRIDILAAFENSIYASCLDRLADDGDILHTNTLERLDGSLADRSPVFAAGNFLISVRELDTVAIVDGRTGVVVWALSGLWIGQHQPTLLDSGHLLVFDNRGCGGRSKVIEIDPLSQEVFWVYDDQPDHPLYSKLCGSVQRLPGGNTFITESDNGRALEVTPEGRIVWEFRNPRRAGKDREFIASILDMVVLPADFRLDWLTDEARQAGSPPADPRS